MAAAVRLCRSKDSFSIDARQNTRDGRPKFTPRSQLMTRPTHHKHEHQHKHKISISTSTSTSTSNCSDGTTRDQPHEGPLLLESPPPNPHPIPTPEACPPLHGLGDMSGTDRRRKRLMSSHVVSARQFKKSCRRPHTK
jgi:hypothetical protein